MWKKRWPIFGCLHRLIFLIPIQNYLHGLHACVLLYASPEDALRLNSSPISKFIYIYIYLMSLLTLLFAFIISLKV